jgi:hypothetical protein
VASPLPHMHDFPNQFTRRIIKIPNGPPTWRPTSDIKLST